VTATVYTLAAIGTLTVASGVLIGGCIVADHIRGHILDRRHAAKPTDWDTALRQLTS
jgi:hypothetical protein